MEQKIFAQGMSRLTNQSSYFTAKSHIAPLHQAWFEDQIDQALDESDNKALPFDLPAVLWQFLPSTYEKGNTASKGASGSFVLHIAQNKFVDGAEDSASLEDYNKLLAYADLVIDLLDAYQLACTAKVFMVNVERDHTNRPVLVDKITFSWSGVRRKPDGVPA